MSRTTTTILASLLAMLAPACKPTAGLAFSDLQYPQPTKTVRIGTADVAYTELGSGDTTLVLIHGLGSSLRGWDNNLEALAARHRVIAIDLPGYGKSSKADWAYSMEFFAKVVRGVVRQLGVTRPVLVGHSMGGQIAMKYALMYPDDVAALVLASPAGLETFGDAEAKWMAGATTPEFTCRASAEAVYVRHAQNFHRMPKTAAFMVEDRLAVVGGPDFDAYCTAVSRSVTGMLDEPVHDDIPEIAVPTLVVFGENDQLIPNPFLHGGSTRRLAERAVQRFPDARLVMLPRAGHMAQFEQADAWNVAVLEFLAGSVRDARPRQRPRSRPHADGGAVQELYEPGTDPDETPPTSTTPEPTTPGSVVTPPPATEPVATDPEPVVIEEPVP